MTVPNKLTCRECAQARNAKYASKTVQKVYCGHFDERVDVVRAERCIHYVKLIEKLC